MNLRPLLYVDDDKENLSTLKRVLRGKYEVEAVASGAEALEVIEKSNYPVVVSDQRMPQMTGVDFLQKMAKVRPQSVGILLTAYTDMDPLVEGVNAGVIYRYLAKPWKETDLLQALSQAFEKYDLVQERDRLLQELANANVYLKKEIEENFDFSGLAGADQGLKKVTQLITKVAPTTSTVLIRGESGVGKELVARSIHRLSPRQNKPFIRVNCGALAEGILESELFGHEKGAFTGAEARRIGRFEAADGGTLFLDEVGDLSPKLQIDFLRVLQEKEFQRVGGNETIKVDVRVLAATHRNLEQLSESEKFRQDLFYRLNVFPISVPALRQHMEDLPLLCERLIAQASQRTGTGKKAIHPAATKKLQGYDWPGNVRELENVLERALILSTTDQIEAEDILLGTEVEAPEPEKETPNLTKEAIEKVLLSCGGNKVQAAKELGIKRPTLYYHLKRLGLG